MIFHPNRQYPANVIHNYLKVIYGDMITTDFDDNSYIEGEYVIKLLSDIKEWLKMELRDIKINSILNDKSY